MASLLVTCDDCGLSEGINRAALALHAKGIAGSAGVMANFPATQHALELFRAVPALGVGVHLNLTEGKPLTRFPWAAGLARADGRLHPAASLVRQAMRPGAVYVAAVAQELRAQIELVAAGGLKPSHLSTHLHFHLFPRLRDIVLLLAESYHISWVRPHRLRAALVPFNPLLDHTLAARASRYPGAAAAPGYIAVVRYWLGRPPTALAAALAGLPGTVELIVHPGAAVDPGFPAGVSYGPRARLRETEYLEKGWPLVAALALPSGRAG